MQGGLNARMRETLATRLKNARKAAKLTQEQLQELSGVPQSVISKTERGERRNPEGLLELAKALKVDAYWLKTGEEATPSNQENITPVNNRGSVPLISWVAAGNFREIHDMFEPGEAEEWVEVSETQFGKNSFALRVSGDSMTSPYPGELSFPDGCILIVDPARATTAGDFVIAKDVVTKQATFKKLAHDGGRWFLKPLNPTYPTIEIDDPDLRVIGRVVEFQLRRKL